jgi:hypothetical protein
MKMREFQTIVKKFFERRKRRGFATDFSTFSIFHLALQLSN